MSFARAFFRHAAREFRRGAGHAFETSGSGGVAFEFGKASAQEAYQRAFKKAWELATTETKSSQEAALLSFRQVGMSEKAALQVFEGKPITESGDRAVFKKELEGGAEAAVVATVVVAVVALFAWFATSK